MKQVIVWTKQGKKVLTASKGQTLLELLKSNHIMITAPCGGQGVCGKCKVKVYPKGKEHRECGQVVLACETYVNEEMEIEVLSEARDISVVDEFQAPLEYRDYNNILKEETETKNERKQSGYGIAVDLGTTTIVAQLIQLATNECIHTQKALNPQSIYGADVISRIKAANEGAAIELKRVITKKILDMVETFMMTLHHMEQTVKKSNETEEGKENSIDCYAIKEDRTIHSIVIAGNTTMLHLLFGYSVEGLGKYPFAPEHIEATELSFYELVAGKLDSSYRYITDQIGSKIKVIGLPGISAFVGADITAGLYALNWMKHDGIHLFLDLGTNGEIAIGNREELLVSATAAGPAFEGSGLSCGIGSVSGAISSVELKGRIARYKTIDNKLPIGLCGTGAIDLLAELLRTNRVNSEGLLNEEYRQKGYEITNRAMNDAGRIFITQSDIRQLQLAKAAIRAGITVLIERYGCEYDQIQHFYIAGGMGYHLNIENATKIGLIPEELADKVVLIGNSSLGGSVKYLRENRMEELETIVKNCRTINLAEQDGFQDILLSQINFK